MEFSCFDAHCDTVARCLQQGESMACNSGHLDFRRSQQLGRCAQIFAMFHNAAKAPPDGMAAQLQRMYRFFRQQVAENSHLVRHCRSGAEIDAAVAEGKVAALLSIEDGALLDCDPENVAMAAEWGVKMVNLVWNHPTAIAGTNCARQDQGLTARGRDFVRELERQHIYADASHLSDAGFWDLIRMARQPVVASHSNARALCTHSRNLTDDMFRAIRDSGGVVGLNYYLPFVGLSGDMGALVAHVEHFLNLGGEKTLCLGGDLDGCDALPQGLSGIEDVPRLYAALRQRGYDPRLLVDLFWNNLRRMMA